MKKQNLNYPVILAASVAVTVGCSNAKEKKAKIEKPNIIYILADDMGYGDLQSLNPDSRIPTPNMDRIVKQGVHFTDAHSNSAVSTPTRYGILTGRYAFRSSLKSGVLWGYSPSLIEPGRETVATLLKKNGYTTSCIGKWHLGLDWQKKNSSKDFLEVKPDKMAIEDYDDNIDYEAIASGGPADHGFDYSLVIPASLDMSPYCYVENGKALSAATAYTEGKSQEVDGRGVFWRAGKMSPGFDFFQVLPTFVDSACRYIKQNAKGEKPFFLYLPLPGPHTPWMPTDEYTGKSKSGRYGDFVAMFDDMVGKVLSAVEGAGIDDNTLIIVTSDNGSDWLPSDIDAWGHRANYIFKGRKADIYEAGHRVPFIAKWKGVVPEGSKSDGLMCSTDLMATLAGLLGQNLPDGAGEDSFNQWPAFVGKANSPIRDYIVHHSLDGFFSIRKGNWKFTPHLGSGGFTQPKSVVPQVGEPAGTLYDIMNDPRETNNLYEQHPEIVKELSAQLEKYISVGSK